MIDALSLLDAFFIVKCEVEYPWSCDLRSVDDGANAWMMSNDVSRACFERLIDIVNQNGGVDDVVRPVYDFALSLFDKSDDLWQKRNISVWREYVDGMIEEDGYPPYPANLDPYIGFGAWVDRRYDEAITALQAYYDVAYQLYVDACRRLKIEPSSDAFPKDGIIEFQSLPMPCIVVCEAHEHA